MRIALHHVGEVGLRAGRILLGDRRVEVVGVIGRSPIETYGGRVVETAGPDGFDVLVTDDPDPDDMIGQATASGVSAVVWVEVDSPETQDGDVTVLTGANLASGIAPCLASHEVAQMGPSSRAIIAWTEPGNPLRSGKVLAFPDPVGGRWGRRFARGDDTRFVVPIQGDWAGALARVESPDGKITRIVGVADLAPHLEALALAAGALGVGEGAYGPGWVRPADAPDAYLAEALGIGLDVAAHTMNGS